MSKRKAPSEERRRPSPEINLLAGGSERGVFSKARRGCSIPFLGGSLLPAALLAILLHTR